MGNPVTVADSRVTKRKKPKTLFFKMVKNHTTWRVQSMKTTSNLLLLLTFIISIFFTGCGLANSHYITYNFEKERVMVANVGAEMLNWTETYKNDVYGTILGTFEQTLTYSGKQGTVIKIFYREASNGFARPSFTQELTYDITGDPIVTFRNTKIKVVEATNSLIKFIVLESPAYKYKSGTKVQ